MEAPATTTRALGTCACVRRAIRATIARFKSTCAIRIRVKTLARVCLTRREPTFAIVFRNIPETIVKFKLGLENVIFDNFVFELILNLDFVVVVVVSGVQLESVHKRRVLRIFELAKQIHLFLQLSPRFVP